MYSSELSRRWIEARFDEEAFLSLQPDWERLVLSQSTRAPQLSWSWLWSWWECFGRLCPQSGRIGSLEVLVFSDDQNVIAILPFFFQGRRAFHFDMTRLRLMGYNGELEPNGLTEEPLYVIQPGYEVQVFSETAKYLSDGLSKGKWDCVQFGIWHSEARVLSESAREEMNRHICWTKHKAGMNLVKLPETWSVYKKELSKSMRENLPYYPKLLKRHDLDSAIEVLTEVDEVEAAVGELVRLHRLRVEQDPNHSHENYFQTIDQERFYIEAVVGMLPLKEAFVAKLVIEGDTAAVQVFLRKQDTLLVHYSGFDPKYSKYSPLFILQARVFQDALESGVQHLDLMAGNALWQKRWNALPVNSYSKVLAVRKHVASIGRAAVYVTRRELHAFWRRSGFRRRFSKKVYSSDANGF